MNSTITKILEAKAPVMIVRTDERGPKGKYEYAVVVVGNEDFWLGAFRSEERARNYCQKYELPIEEK